MSKRTWLLLTPTCGACGQPFPWLTYEGGPVPRTCGGACWAALDARQRELPACLKCRARPPRWRGLCEPCFRALQHVALRQGGWDALVAEGLALPRAKGHGNPDREKCSYPGCRHLVRCLGLCGRHYEKQRSKTKRRAKV